ncbi:MAG: substrate-binding domain-containing protein [Oscillospiraceae bacterium]|nr:substrate-binding domain-containing protein [Oscillospiraceae bacterium]
MKKLIALLLSILMLTTVLTGCGDRNENVKTETTAANSSDTGTAAPAAAKSNETYYYICPLSNLEYWQAHKAGLEDACAELGVTAKFVGDDGLDVDAMCAVIETALNDPNCAGIVMQANFPDAYEPYVKQAKEKGIPVCYQTVDGVKDSARLCFLGTDYVEYGKIMMQQAAEATGGKGNVIYSNNLSAGSASVEDITNGIHEEIENWPDMKIVSEIDDTSDAAVAATKIGAALLANDGVSAVIGGQSVSAVGAVTAIKEAGKSDDVKVISIDRDSATLEYIQNGDIYSTVAGKQYTEVYYGVKFCYDYNHGAKNAFSADDAAAGLNVAPSFVDTGALIINKNNVDKFVGFSYVDR